MQKQKDHQDKNLSAQTFRGKVSADKHIPVLLEEVLTYLSPNPNESYLDLTAGYGGHAETVMERTLNGPTTLIDRDQYAISYLEKKFQGKDVQIISKDFLTASQELQAAGKQFDMILADLGVSSHHLDEPGRGFSFQAEGPLDMRMDQRQSLTAETIVNSYGEEELTNLLKEYGEEPKARAIARLIIGKRPLKTTGQLAKLVSQAWPGYSKTHPATRTFQALRMAVNSELELLKMALPVWVDLLSPGGRIVVISFHSLEDRLVKQTLNEAGGNRYDATLKLLTKQPVVGGKDEIVFNPRARSAKLRAAVKIKTNERGS